MNPLPLADIVYSFRESNVSGKVITLILFFSSIYIWTVMVTKFLELKRAGVNSRRFLHAFRKEDRPLALFLRRHEFAASPVYALYEKGCMAFPMADESRDGHPGELFAGSTASENLPINRSQLERVRNTVDRNFSDQLLILERRMSVLASAVTTCPFLGLLGTVWGVMDSFGSMAIMGSANLSAVAPGIAGALLTTVIALLVALPSAVGYNLLAARIRELHVLTDNFAQEFAAEIERQHLVER